MDSIYSMSSDYQPLDDAATMNVTTDHAYMLDDHPTQITLLIVILCVISALGLVGNIPVVLVVACSPKLQTVTNAFIASLSVCSFVTCLTIPYHVTTLLGDSPPSHGACLVVSTILITTQIVSLLTLTLIAVNRVSVMRASSPLYQKVFSKSNACLMIVASWLLPLSVIILVAAVGFVTLGYSDKYKICIVQADSSSVAAFTAGVVIGFPSVMVIVVCYIFIFKFTRHHHSEIKKGLSRDALRASCDFLDDTHSCGDELDDVPPPIRKNGTINRLSNLYVLADISIRRGSFNDLGHSTDDRRKSATERIISKRQHKISRNLFFIVCVFVVFVMPFCFAIVIPNTDAFIVWFGVLLLSNSAINPILYGFLHPQFKESFKNITKHRRIEKVQDKSGLYGRMASFTAYSHNKRNSAAV